MNRAAAAAAAVAAVVELAGPALEEAATPRPPPLPLPHPPLATLIKSWP